MTLDRARLATLSDYLAAAAIVSLPWSTSATSILVPLWAVAAALMLDGAALRRMLATPAATIPVALGVLAIVGVLWSEADWADRLPGLSPFLKLLVIPLLFVQFSRSERGEMILAAFLASVGVLLAFSWALVLFPQIPWTVPVPGVPVKDYIIQSAEFVLCCFVLLDRAIAGWGESRVKSLLLAGAALLFLGDIVFVALSRTSVVVIIVLFVLLGLRHFQRGGLALFLAAGVALASFTWAASPYLRSRVTHVATELEGSHVEMNETSAGVRVGFWKMSLAVVRDAPLFGHGTGSIKDVFARAAAADPAAPAGATNPHNQILAIAIQLGLLGVILTLALWAAHFRMFLLPGPMAWVGLSAVAQNFVSSLFNSHISDFSNGWLYVFAIGVAGGVMLRKKAGKSEVRADQTMTAAPSPGLEPAIGPAAMS
jgi:O-antigen ligase